MLFYMKGGKQHIDLGQEFILTLDHNLITTQLKKGAPSGVHNATYILLRKISFWGRIRATLLTIKFIWLVRPSR